MPRESGQDGLSSKGKLIRRTVGGLTILGTAFTLARSAPVPHYEAQSFSQTGHTEQYHGDLFGRSGREFVTQDRIPVHVHGKAVAMLSPNVMDHRGVEANRFAQHAGTRSERQHARSNVSSERNRADYVVHYGSSATRADRESDRAKVERVVVRSTPIAPEHAAMVTANMRTEAALSPTFVPPGEEPMMPQTPWWAYGIFFSPDAAYALGTGINKTFIRSKGLQGKLNAFEGTAITGRVLWACGAGAVSPQTTEVPTMAPTQVEATAVPVTETAIPYNPPTAEVTQTPPPEVAAALPDYANYSSVGFSEPVRVEDLKKGNVPPGMTDAAKEAFIENAMSLYNQLPEADRDRTTVTVCYRVDQNRNVPLLIRNGKEVLWLHQGDTPSFSPFFPSFRADTEEALTYKWVEFSGGTLVCKWDNNSEYPVVGLMANTSDTALASIFNPGEGKFVENPNPVPSPTPTEAAPKNGDTRTENGYTYKYSAEYGQWMREVTNFPLDDGPDYNFVPFRISVSENVDGELDLISLVHKDFTVADIPASGTFNPPPLTASFGRQVRERYFEEDTRNLTDLEQQSAFQMEMLGMGKGPQKDAYIPIIVSNGEEMRVKLSEQTGINMFIIDPDTMMQRGGANVITLHRGEVTFYVEVYGVDPAGNMLVRMAFDGSLADISNDDLRAILFTIPANFADHKDQREQGFTAYAQALADLSDNLQSDGVTPDVVINRAP